MVGSLPVKLTLIGSSAVRSKTWPLVGEVMAGEDGGGLVKVAMTDFASLIVTSQLPLPEQAPDHPWKTYSSSGVALSVTFSPSASSTSQLFGEKPVFSQ